MTVVTLVLGGTQDARERAIATAIPKNFLCAAIIEGLPSGINALDQLAPELELEVARVAPGCPCCTGNLTVRVTLNRLLKRTPQQLYLSLLDATHRESVLAFLQEPQYRDRLVIGPDLRCE
ncbi:MAG: GTPase [Betaproteobacteria bacterium]